MKTGALFYLLFILLFDCSDINQHNPFGQPIIVFTFDDAHKSIIENAFPLFEHFGYVATNYVPIDFIKKPWNMNVQDLIFLEEHGWETGGHGKTHADLNQIGLDSARTEIYLSWKFLRDHQLSHASFALPNGHGNEQVRCCIRDYFCSIRSSEDYKMSCPIDPLWLGYYDARPSDGASGLQCRILRGIQNHECLIIIGFHQVIADKYTMPRAITPQELHDTLEFVKKRHLPVMTISQAIAALAD
ncbi:polysaccharide deacetylase family protein [candidate division KSB1 bacterium]|nr:polysaccharide deacetylase family protein [candidate division KSB1 bacterium]